MTAIVPPPWIPEDDLLLKNAVEAGASLEALAKGAVQFSRRFTFQELQDRWHSLLYDPDIAAQASALMGELEGGSSNLSSKFNRSDKSKESKMVHEKRKVGSIRKQYYAMRKRIRSEFFSPADLEFLTGNGGEFHEQVTLADVPPVGNSMLRDCMPNHFGLQETDFDIPHHAFPQTMTDITATNAVANVGDAFQSEGPDSLADNQISTITRNSCSFGFPDDVSSLSVRDSLRYNETKPFQQSNECKDISHGLEDNAVDFGKCSGVDEMDTSQPLSGRKLFVADHSETRPLSTFDSTNNNLQNVCSEFEGRQHFSSPNSDGSASFHTMGFSPPLPSMPLWKTMEDISAPAMPVNVSPDVKRQGAEDVSELPDNDDCKRKGSSGNDVIHSGPMLTDKQNGDGFINSNAMSDGEFADLPDSLLDFSNEDGILFVDVDGKETLDKPCYDNTPLLSSTKNVDEGDAPKVEPKTMIVSNTGLATAGGSCAGESEVITSHVHTVCGDQQSVSHSGVKMPSTSALYSKFIERTDGNLHCTLNTEDPEIPCNDDIFLLIHPTASFSSSAIAPITINAIDHVSYANEKDSGQGLKLMKKGEDPAQCFKPSMMVGPYMLPESGPDHAIVGCTVKSELPDTSCMSLPSRHKAIGEPTQCRSAHATPNSAVDEKLENDVTKIELGVVDTPGTFREFPLHAEAGSVEITLRESMVNPSTSDQEEPDSDNDVPCFSDIEAMILEMDLGSYDQDLYFSRRVSQYQNEDSKRKIIRLEQCARSSLQRDMASQGALAILYGRHVKHFIRKTEVILGRSTDEADVDIDLGKGGRANKISRRQAIIKMEEDGSFFLKNLGKSSILVNGKAVGTEQSMGLGSSCLIEIRGMSFMFEMNHKSVRRYLDNIAKKSQGQRTNFEWSPRGALS